MKNVRRRKIYHTHFDESCNDQCECLPRKIPFPEHYTVILDKYANFHLKHSIRLDNHDTLQIQRPMKIELTELIHENQQPNRKLINMERFLLHFQVAFEYLDSI